MVSYLPGKYYFGMIAFPCGWALCKPKNWSCLEGGWPVPTAFVEVSLGAGDKLGEGCLSARSDLFVNGISQLY